MPFVELTPRSKPRPLAEVRMSCNRHHGVILTFSGRALGHLDCVGTSDAQVKAFLDPDPAAPRLRVIRDAKGSYRLRPPPRGEGVLMLRLGYVDFFKDAEIKATACEWEPIDGGLEISLPTKGRPVERVTVPISRARDASVTLPKLRCLDGQ